MPTYVMGTRFLLLLVFPHQLWILHVGTCNYLLRGEVTFLTLRQWWLTVSTTALARPTTMYLSQNLPMLSTSSHSLDPSPMLMLSTPRRRSSAGRRNNTYSILLRGEVKFLTLREWWLTVSTTSALARPTMYLSQNLPTLSTSSHSLEPSPMLSTLRTCAAFLLPRPRPKRTAPTVSGSFAFHC